MFDFLFKRNTKAAAQVQAQQALLVAQQLAQQKNKKQEVEQQRQNVLAKIEQSAGNESELITLLLACDFADGRLKAAQHIHSKAGLLTVLAAIRNTDKRVAKLMQSRLDVIAYTAQQQALAEALIAQAHSLMTASPLTANQLVELDRQHASILAFPESLVGTFTDIRRAIGERLLSQTVMQRQVLVLIAKLSELQKNGGDAEIVEQLQQEYQRLSEQPEAASLPKALRQEFNKKLELAREVAGKVADSAVVKAINAGAADESLHASLADEASSNAANTFTVDSIIPQDVVESLSASDDLKLNLERSPNSMSVDKIIHAIHGIEEALEQGRVLAAQAIDRELRGIDAKKSGLSNEQKERLLRARSELAHLQGWAKWGGSVSRDELIKAAEELPQKELPVLELAKKVGSLRERWKLLEASAGSASKESWERFDAACTLAYAPAALHFQQLAEERKANLEKAEGLISEFRAQAERLLQAEHDWKAIGLAMQQARQAWQKKGHVERKHKPRIDAEFDAVYALLSAPFSARQAEAISERKALIAAAQAIAPDQRNALEQLRALQAQWQAQAQALSLRRNDEQVLWEQFRAACDAVFAQRRAASESQDVQRKDNLLAKQALCGRLEQASITTPASAQKLLQELATEWRATGYVDRDAETAIEQRYQTAIGKINQAIQQLRTEQAQQTKAVMHQKLHIIQRLEIALLQATEAERASASETWTALADLKTPIDAVLKTRFERALQAAEQQDLSYARLLQDNATRVDEKLLQLEVLSGIDSPAEFAQSRLQAQVDALRSSLKTGGTLAAADQLRNLLSLPAALHASQLTRLDALIAHHGV